MGTFSIPKKKKTKITTNRILAYKSFIRKLFNILITLLNQMFTVQKNNALTDMWLSNKSKVKCITTLNVFI